VPHQLWYVQYRVHFCKPRKLKETSNQMGKHCDVDDHHVAVHGVNICHDALLEIDQSDMERIHPVFDRTNQHLQCLDVAHSSLCCLVFLLHVIFGETVETVELVRLSAREELNGTHRALWGGRATTDRGGWSHWRLRGAQRGDHDEGRPGLVDRVWSIGFEGDTHV